MVINSLAISSQQKELDNCTFDISNNDLYIKYLYWPIWANDTSLLLFCLDISWSMQVELNIRVTSYEIYGTCIEMNPTK